MVMSNIVDVLIERTGSQLKAASMIGVSHRHVQKWCCGHSQPSRSSYLKILMFLEGDRGDDREQRILLYTNRAERGEPLFG